MLLLPLGAARDDLGAAGRAVEAWWCRWPADCGGSRPLRSPARRDFADVAVRAQDRAALARRVCGRAAATVPQEPPPSAPGGSQCDSYRPANCGRLSGFLFEPQGELLPWFAAMRLSVSLNDATSNCSIGGREEWTERLSNNFRNVALAVAADRLAPLVCRVYGHLAICRSAACLRRPIRWPGRCCGSGTCSAATPFAPVRSMAGPADGLPRLQFPMGRSSRSVSSPP
jgi:hypothetical protein